MRISLLRVLILSLFGGFLCPALAQEALEVPEGVRVERGIRYATTPQQDLELDIYMPAETPGRALPLVVWIHGGGWRQGSRDRNRAAFLVPHGYISASISYRLSGVAKFPSQIYDCKAAIRWLRANAAKYNIDPTRVGVWGSSAGGHLVALLGTSGGVRELEGRVGVVAQSSRVQAVVDYFGPTDFLRMNDFPSNIDHDAPNSPESLLIGGPIQERRDAVARANPITYVSEDDPPFLIVHGDRDPLVPINQSSRLFDALTGVGVDVTMYTVKGGGHGRDGEFGSQKLRDMVKDFFDLHLKGSANGTGN